MAMRKTFFIDRKGFTLVEMLIVIAIIAILATVAIANYSGVRQKAKLSIVADTLVSLIKKQQGTVKSGKGTSLAQQQVKCYGLIFNTNKTPYVSLVNVPYVAFGPNGADYCDLRSDKSVQTVNELEDFLIIDLKQDQASLQELEFYFKPPFAKPIVATDQTNIFSGQIEITLTPSNKSERRIIKFDATSGLISD